MNFLLKIIPALLFFSLGLATATEEKKAPGLPAPYQPYYDAQKQSVDETLPRLSPATEGEVKPANPAATPQTQAPLPPAEPSNPLIIKAPVTEGGNQGEATQSERMPAIHVSPRLAQVINLPQPVAQILLTDPKVADVQLPNQRTMYVYGRTNGVTEIVATSTDGTKSYRFPVVVKTDLSELNNLIKTVTSHGPIKISNLPDGVVLQGNVDNAMQAEDIRTLAKHYVGSQASVVNQLKIKGSSQVNLRVKIAEVKRNVVNQLGINWAGSSSVKDFRFGLATGRAPIDAAGAFIRPDTSSLPLKALGIRHVDSPNYDFASVIDALAQESLATILAEPNLITASGEEASFLVGGEFPYPISQGTGANLTISFQFKQYGISLSFIPYVMGDTITMRVRPEVSDLDLTQTIEDQNGNNIPSIRTRKAESTVEMGNGQSMVMAGLLSETASSSIDAVPALGNLPILGALFRSNQFRSEKTELVIVVTPYLVDPIDNPQDVALPTDGLQYASLLEMVLFRRLNRVDEEAGGGEETPKLVGEHGFYF
jgi:pilus assembly protein CpaC